ncbi:DegV family protein [Fervidobacterium pennivorans subsp. shakshaketiis]|jgi:DegV family protein with EDD domain|uniref:EDD domain protein, DegV family n=1 Tax=Fervidobacterium pennivorans (strain DSM 9078 / Ven5) TaxID=771875 RepID=H9UB82_FERPD|nr:DegV family protein [Fervidobacterium pennivorans]AFG34775.1 EDD domain protein, DegV family [Fervidobacterium pennivorans DSM 9078]QIV78049.1 DegV family protein [Fervidobacterium pennivorans subsp. keratinolyticus]
MKNIYLFDSSVDYQPGLEFGVPTDMFPLRVYIDDTEYIDKVTITDEQFYNFCLSGAKVSTSQPKPEMMREKLTKYSKEYENVYVVTISQKLSGTYDTISSIVKEEKLKNVTVLDSKSGSVKTTYVLYRVINAVENGLKVTQEIVDTFVKDSLLVFSVSSLEYLERGGRIGHAKALLGKLLRIKPILTTTEDGYTASLGMERTHDGLIRRMRELTKEFMAKIGSHIVIGGYGVSYMKEHLDKLLEGFNVHSIARIGPAIAAHVGPEVFGLVVGRGY